MKEFPDHSGSKGELHPASKVLVVGLGKTGISCVRYLAAQGMSVSVVDSREQPPGLALLKKDFPAVPVFLGAFTSDLFKHANHIVVSPGVSLQEPVITEAHGRGATIIGDIELFARAVTAPVIAITGSNGKSTVTSLVAHMAELAGQNVGVGGNLGIPALDLLQGDESDIYVLELSSFQLEATFSLHTQVSVVLNVSADHMDRYSGIKEYAAAKARIYQHANVQIANADDLLAKSLTEPNIPVVVYGTQDSASVDYGLRMHDGQEWLMRQDEPVIPVSELRIAGRHNVSNALAALAVGDVADFPLQAMRQALCSFEGLPHRTQWVAEKDGIRWYNDSKGTNVGATVAAIRGLQQPLVLIAGGQGKGADFTPLREVVREKVRGVVVLGQDGSRIRDVLTDVVPVVSAGDMDEAVVQAARLTRPGDAVLLSPACASFDMFSNYEERGHAFMEAVTRYLS